MTEQPWDRRVGSARQFLVLLDEALQIRFVNRLRPGRDDPTGRSLLDFMPADQHQRLRAAAAAARDGGRPEYFEARASGPDGQSSWYSTWVLPLAGRPGEASLAVIAEDVTDQVRTEQALELEKGVLQSLVANAPDQVMVVDRHHRVQFANRVEPGWSMADVLGQSIESLAGERFRDRVHGAIEHVFGTGESTAYETEVDLADGPHWFATRVGPVLRRGRVERVSLVSTDITAQVQRERALAEERTQLEQSEERFRTLVNHAPEAVVILDADDGQFVDVNDKACTLFGLSRERLLQCGPADVSPARQPDGADSAVAARSQVQAALSGAHSVFEWTHRNAAGAQIPCEVRLVRLPHRSRLLVRGSIIDIGERKRAEAERERLTLELAQAQKLQAIGQLTGGVAHDFNNLLTVIMSSVELIDADPASSARLRGYAGHALAAAERAADLTQRLLAFARRQPLRPRLVDVNTLVRESESLLRRTLGADIRIDTRLADALWTSETDPTQLENVILNLAINARDAMPDGGQLTIETANVQLTEAELAEHADVAPGPYVRLVVRDDGCGMAPQVLQQAFEPFFTTKPTGRGSGLGLSMVYGFVKQCRGHVAIDSVRGQGTTVRIYLPRSAPSAAPSAADGTGRPGEAMQTAQPHGEARLVLVVEDEDAVRTLVVQGLEALGYRALGAANAGVALEALRSSPDVALLLTDVVLSGTVHGPELARRARGLRPGLPVLFMSGYADNALADDGRVDPRVELLEKPFSRRQLGLAVWRAIERAAASP